MGVHTVTISHESAIGATMSTSSFSLIVSTPLCEPSAAAGGLTLAAGAALTMAQSTTTVVSSLVATATDLTPAFTISSTEQTCKLTYALAWHFTADSYNLALRTSSTWAIAADTNVATITLAANSGYVEGIHVFDVTVKSIFGAAVTGANTLTFTKSAAACAAQTQLTTAQTTIVAKHRLQAAAAVVSFASGLAPSSTGAFAGCAYQYEVVVPAALNGWLTVSLDKTAPSFTMDKITGITASAHIGRHTVLVKYLTIEGVAAMIGGANAVQSVEIRVNDNACEETSGGALAATAASASGTVLARDLGDAVTATATVGYSWAVTSAVQTCTFTFAPSGTVTNLITVDNTAKQFTVLTNKDIYALGPYTLRATAETVEGDLLTSVWTRNLQFTNVCVDDIITLTAFATAPSYTLWTESAEWDASTLVTTKTHSWCLQYVEWTWTIPSGISSAVVLDTKTNKFSIKKNDDPTLAKAWDFAI